MRSSIKLTEYVLSLAEEELPNGEGLDIENISSKFMKEYEDAVEFESDIVNLEYPSKELCERSKKLNKSFVISLCESINGKILKLISSRNISTHPELSNTPPIEAYNYKGYLEPFEIAKKRKLIF